MEWPPQCRLLRPVPKVKPRPRDNVKVAKEHEAYIQGALKYMAAKQKGRMVRGEKARKNGVIRWRLPGTR